MPRPRILLSVLLAAGAIAAAPAGAEAAPPSEFSLGTAFTYQGTLQQHGLPAEGSFDLAFELYDSAEGGTFLGRIDRLDQPIAGGGFAVELDFGVDVYSVDAAWLEIQVRPAGGAGYTTLAPRQRAASVAGNCVVNGDVLINGTLDVDPVGAQVGIDVACCNGADLNGGGQMVLGGFLQEVAFDNDAIQSRAIGGAPYQFQINPQGGNVGVGVASPQAPLHLPGAPDVSPSSGGALVIGALNGPNIAIDQNEIMARNNGGLASLTLNAAGGPVAFGGPIVIGLQIVFGSSPGDTAFASCPAGQKLTGGGCNCGADDVEISYPLDHDTWQCACSGSGTTASVVCANIQ
jgi:hypothetical protein